MNLRHSIQSALGIGMMALSSSAFVYGSTENALSVSRGIAKDVALINKFYDGSLNTREGILELQNILGIREDHPFPLFHKFSGGLYTREMHVPKGVLLVGKIHKYEHLVHLTKGSILVADEFGTRKLTAPATFNSKEGVKRVGYILEDIVWIDIHKTDATNVEDAEKDIFIDSYEDLDIDKNIINGEYESVINELGFSVNQVRNITESTEDMIFDEQDNVEIKESVIEGKGVFVTKSFKENEIVGTARIGNKRTLIGRYTNHQSNPNTVSEIKDNDAVFIAIKAINIGDEVTINYKNAVATARKLDSIGAKSCQA